MNDAGDIPIKCSPCVVDGCPLVALCAHKPGGLPIRCVFHATGRTNALDLEWRLGLTANAVLRALVFRRRMAVDLFAIKKRDPATELRCDEKGIRIHGARLGTSTPWIDVAHNEVTLGIALTGHRRQLEAL